MMGEVVLAAIVASWILGVLMGWTLYKETLEHNAKSARKRRDRRANWESASI